MKVSFDGMRRNATHSMNRLYDMIKTITDDDSYQKIDDDLKEELISIYNDSAISVDMFNCLYDDDIEDDMNDLTDALSINRFEA